MSVRFLSTYSDEKFHALLVEAFARPLTFERMRKALIAFAPERLHAAVIAAYREATALPAEVFLLKCANLVDQLVPDDEEDAPEDTEPVICEQCGQAVEQPNHLWCQDCWLRVFYPLPNERDPEP